MGLKIFQPYPASQININIRRCWALTLRHEARQHLQYNTLGLHRSGRYKGLQLFPFSASFPIIHLHTCKFYQIPTGAGSAQGGLDLQRRPIRWRPKRSLRFRGERLFCLFLFLGAAHQIQRCPHGMDRFFLLRHPHRDIGLGPGANRHPAAQRCRHPAGPLEVKY